MNILPAPDVVFAVRESTAHKLTFTIYDEDGAPVPSSNLASLTLTLHLAETDEIVNSRNAQDVLNTNNVTVDVNGLVTWAVQPSDTTFLYASRKYEDHIALFEWTYPVGSGSRSGHYEIRLLIRNRAYVP